MLRQCSVDIMPFAKKLSIHPVLARLLYVRGFKNLEDMDAFLNEDKFGSVWDFLGMRQGVETTLNAVRSKKRIAIFGDYDADGIMSTVILYRLLLYFDSDVSYYIPKRETEGYGLSMNAVNSFREDGIDLIITCDNGISAVQEVAYARELNIDVVIIDHHDVSFDFDNRNTEYIPPANAVINPKQKSCPYPFKMYCAGGLSYRFAEAICEASGINWEIFEKEFSVFAAIATVCDLVELKNDNRVLLKRALPRFSSCNNIGLAALIKAALPKVDNPSVYHIGYVIGPCINASGRLEIADLAVDLFMTKDIATAETLAKKLVDLNISRKEYTLKGAKSAVNQISFDSCLNDDVLVVYCPDINPSISGIVAGRIKEVYYKPTIILAGTGSIIKGSCRSIEKYNMFEALLECRELLDSFGGHPMAAGLTIKRDRIDAFRAELNKKSTLTPDDLTERVYIDYQLPLTHANLDFARVLEGLEPFGKGNIRPLFADRNIKVERVLLLGKNEQVLKLQCLKDNKRVELISFTEQNRFFNNIKHIFGEKTWDMLLKGAAQNIFIDLLYTLHVNEYRGFVREQLQIVDYRFIAS